MTRDSSGRVDLEDPLSTTESGGSSVLPLPPATNELTPFRVRVPEQAVRDLHSRLRSARWPEKEPVSDWSQGVPLSELQALIGYCTRTLSHDRC